MAEIHFTSHLRNLVPDGPMSASGVTVGEALENVPAKQFKEADLWPKTKTPVLVLRTDNQIPKE